MGNKIVDSLPEGEPMWVEGVSDLAAKIEAWIRHREAVPADVTTYDRSIVHAELRDLVQSTDTTEQARAASLSDEAMLAELVKRGRLKVELTIGEDS